MERKRFSLSEYLYYGNWDLFMSAVGNPENIFVYDVDGILLDSSKPVFSDFERKTGLSVHPTQIDRWGYLDAPCNNS